MADYTGEGNQLTILRNLTLHFPGIRTTDVAINAAIIARLALTIFGLLTSLLLQANSATALPINEQLADNLPLITLTPEKPGHFPIGSYSAFLEDTSADLQLADVVAATGWQISKSENPNFGFSKSAFWLIARVDTSKVKGRWFVRNHYSLIDHFDLYTCASLLQLQDCQQQRNGDRLPFSQRTVNHPELVIPLPEMSEPYWLLFRMATEGTHQFPTDLIDEKSLYDDLLLNSWLRGGYISMMLIMGLYNLFLYFSTRDRIYLYYSVFVLNFLLFHSSYSGDAFQYLWPDQPEINQYALPWLFSTTICTMSLFIQRFLDLANHSPIANTLFRMFFALALISLIASLFLPYRPVVAVQNVLMLAITLLALLLGIHFWIKGFPSARIFTLAWVFFIAGLSLATARSLGLVPTNLFTIYGYQAGSFAEILLLSLALGERITELHREKLRNRKALLISQEESIHHLRNYEDLYQNSFSGQFQIDRQGHFIKSNPAWRAMIGQDTIPANLTLKSLFQNHHDFIRLEHNVNREGRTQGFIFALIQPNTQRQLMISISIRQALDGENAHWIGNAQDVSEKYQKEEKLRQLQEEKNQSLRQLVMGVSHEMNTPLGNIRMTQSFLKDQAQLLSDDQQLFTDGLNHIDNSVQRLCELNALMKSSIAVDREYQQDTIRIRQWLTTWANQLDQGSNAIHIKHEVHCFTVDWHTYPDALKRILDQLVSNSVNHNQEKAESGQLSVNISVTDDDDYLILRYCDNGKGVAIEDRDKVFLPFYTTQRQHASSKGLGLYQMHNLVTELMQGVIQWPEHNKGFEIELRFLQTPPKVDNC